MAPPKKKAIPFKSSSTYSDKDDEEEDDEDLSSCKERSENV